MISDYGTSDEALRAAAPASSFLLLGLSDELHDLGETNSQKSRALQDAEYKVVADTRDKTHRSYRKYLFPITTIAAGIFF